MASTDKDFIVAIELGSSRISGVAGKKNSDGSMQILAYAQVKSSSCIKRGVVYNIDKTTQCIGDVIKKLESVLKTKIVRAYVGISGQSLRSFRCSVKRNLLAQSYITSEIIDSLRDDCREIPYQDYEILDNFPQEYLVDANTVSDPVGVMGTNVEGVYLNIIARNTLRMNIHNCFANADVEIADELIAACKLGNHVLSEAEKRSGCALVDLGAETTTVVVYKNNIVRHFVVLPLGANNITKDIVSLQIDEEEAENIKLKYGDACPDLDAEFSDNNKDAEKIVISDGRSFDLFKIHNIIKSRVDEIIENVDNQIISSRYRDKLLAGIILTGGGANLKNIDKSFVEHTKIDKIRLAKASDMPSIKPGISGIELDNMRNNVLLSLLLEGSLPCGGDDINETPSIFDIQAKEEEKQKNSFIITQYYRRLIAENSSDKVLEYYDQLQPEMKENKAILNVVKPLRASEHIESNYIKTYNTEANKKITVISDKESAESYASILENFSVSATAVDLFSNEIVENLNKATHKSTTALVIITNNTKIDSKYKESLSFVLGFCAHKFGRNGVKVLQHKDVPELQLSVLSNFEILNFQDDLDFLTLLGQLRLIRA